jgi:ATP-binding cassette subfamily B multidrug efflux pump
MDISLCEGHLVGHGTHEELLKNSDVYQQLALRQLSMNDVGPHGQKEEE